MNQVIKKIKNISKIKIFTIASIISFIIWVILILIPTTSKAQAYLFFNGWNPCYKLFMDFIDPIIFSQNDLPYEVLNWKSQIEMNYTPFTFILFKIIDVFSKHININYQTNIHILLYSLFMIFICVSMATIIHFNFNRIKNFDKILLITAFFTSGIFLYSFERANIIFLALVLTLFFICYYNSENKILKELSLISLAVAFVLKIYPAVFGLLLLYKRDYKSAFRTVLYGIILFITPALFYPRGLETLITLKHNFALFANYIHTDTRLYSHPAGKSIIADVILAFTTSVDQKSVYKVLDYLMLFLCSLSLFFTFFYKEMWRKILVMSIAVILIPAGSYHYIILFTLPALIAFFCEDKHKKSDYLYLLYFFILYTPIQIVNTVNDINYSFAIQNITICIMFIESFVFGIVSFEKNNGFIKLKAELNNILKEFSNNKQKYILCPLISVFIVFIGFVVYKHNYQYYTIDLVKIPDVIEIDKSPVSLKTDFKIRENIIFMPQENRQSGMFYQVGNIDDGNYISLILDENNQLSLKYKDRTNNYNVVAIAKIDNDKTYKFFSQITNATISVNLQKYNNNEFEDIENANFTKKANIYNKQIQKIQINNQIANVINLQYCLKNGNNTNILVLLTILLSLIPLIIMVYKKADEGI